MSNTDFLNRAIEAVKKATEADRAAEYAQAFEQYKQALGLFELALKWEKNAQSKKIIREKVKEYIDRAEKLKAYLAEQEKRKGANAIGQGGKVGGGSGGQKYVFTQASVDPSSIGLY